MIKISGLLNIISERIEYFNYFYYKKMMDVGKIPKNTVRLRYARAKALETCRYIKFFVCAVVFLLAAAASLLDTGILPFLVASLAVLTATKALDNMACAGLRKSIHRIENTHA